MNEVNSEGVSPRTALLVVALTLLALLVLYELVNWRPGTQPTLLPTRPAGAAR